MAFPVAVTRRFVLSLLILSVALLGSDCEFAARVNNGITPPPEDGPEDGDGEGGGARNPNSGLTVVINNGVDGDGLAGANGSARAATIADALATSVLDTPQRPIDARAIPSAVDPVRALPTPLAAVAPDPIDRSGPVTPVPEPGAFLLFAAGGALVLVMRRSAARPDGETRRDPRPHLE